jgi:hypothetical protein
VPAHGGAGRRRILREGAPLELMRELEGRVWSKTIDKDELEAHRAQHDVISTRLFAGRTVINVLSDTHPGAGFEPVRGGLEEVYFTTLAASRRDAAASKAA